MNTTRYQQLAQLAVDHAARTGELGASYARLVEYRPADRAVAILHNHLHSTLANLAHTSAHARRLATRVAHDTSRVAESLHSVDMPDPVDAGLVAELNQAVADRLNLYNRAVDFAVDVLSAIGDQEGQ